MPANNPPPVIPQADGRRIVERVVPAIPLSLSKSRSTKPKPRSESNAKGGAENIPAETPARGEANVQQEPLLPIANDNGIPETNGAAVGLDDGPVTMPQSDTPGSRGSAAMSLSFGGTPEVPESDATQPSTPPSMDIQATPSSVSPTSARKMSERFDMRQIRTELPPAFIPSAEQHTPQSASSPHFKRPFNARGHAHPSHPSAASIVFGGQDSTASSPPPQSAGSGFASPTRTNFGQHQQHHHQPPPFFVPQGHAHHSSESQAYRPARYAGGYPGMAWQPRQGYVQPMQQAPPFHPNGPASFRYPPRDVYTPSDVPQTNGRISRSRSASQNSSVAPEQRKSTLNGQSSWPAEPSPANAKSDSKTAYHGHNNFRQAAFHPQMAPPLPFQHPDVTANIVNAEALRDHIFTTFSNAQYADCQLIATDDVSDSEHTIDAHKMVLARSPTLLERIRHDEVPSASSSKMVMHIRLKGGYLRIASFVDAIRYLYGGPSLQLDHQRPASAEPEHLPTNGERMESALQSIATGAWLGVNPLARSGVEVATGLLHWETLASALAFALDGGLSHVWAVEDGSEDRVSVSSSEESLSRAEPTAAPTYDPFSTLFLQRIIDFVVHVFPTNFYLDAAAPQLSESPRLPALAPRNDSRPRSDPRLSQIRFGEVPVDDHQRPSFATTTVSSVLLSLPFQILKCVLEHYELAARLGPDTVASIMRQVVAEREARRSKALEAHSLVSPSSPSTHASESRLVPNLYWEEFVEPSAHHRAGFRLARHKRDIDTPPSSGPCSERNK